ncbi:hypothetical protein [Joostella sp. CR20]|uniref:hypothetical protein n=1 Tax=Joostella sp. CR20 TaxID=2804312 RepID=UPI00313D4076
MRIIKVISVLFIFLVTFSCTKQIPPKTSFYFWRTTYKLSSEEKEALQENSVSKLYVRYFDIDLNKENEPIPRSAIRFEELPVGMEIVPVVYIKNRVFLKDTIDLEALATKTFKYIEAICASAKIDFKEVQIDCDWSLKSQVNYLDFIELFKQISKKKLSATIRLHQVKYYTKTKVPNVDEGVLMYYNMGTISSDSLNSIYDKSIARRYIKSLKNYPLKLNYALPIFSWGVQIRNRQVVGVRGKINEADLKADANIIDLKDNFYQVKQSFYKNGVYYQERDIIKIEAIQKADLLEMVSDIEKYTVTPPNEIIYYDLDAINLKNYEKNIFKEVSTSF